MELGEKASCRLYRPSGGRVASGQSCLAKMGYSLKAVAHTSEKYLAAPDGSIVSISRSVKADADDGLVPLAALGEHRRQVRAMMLIGEFVCRGQSQRVHGGRVLRVAIMRDH